MTNQTSTALIRALLLCCAVVSGVFSGAVHAQLVAAVLPSSRSAEVGDTVTVFATIINAGADAVTGCGIESPAELPVTLSFQTTDPLTNQPTGTANALVDLAPGASQSFVLSLTPTAVVEAVDTEFSFSCLSGASAVSASGINTLLLSASATPVADIIALAATIGNTGVLDIDDAAGAFALATINLGAADTVTVAADTGGVDLPVSLSVCETDPTSGACLATPAESLTLSVAAGGTPTFGVFSQATGSFANDPALNRVFVRFTDSGSVVRGGTSVAIENELDLVPSLSDSTLSVLSQIFSLLFGVGQSPSEAIAPSGASVVAPQNDEAVEQTIPCETGQITVTGSIGSDNAGSSSTLVLDFQDCDGLNGMLTAVTDVEFDATTITLVQTQNGSYSTPECEEVRVTDLRVASSFDVLDPLEDVIETAEFSVSGTISGRCEGQSFSCTLQDVDLEDESTFGQSCST